MEIIEITDRNSKLIGQLVEVWENSVRTTHLFLSKIEIENIKQYVPQALKKVQHLIVIENEKKDPIAFIGEEKQKIEMLFVSFQERGKGIGKKLVQYVISKYKVNELCVNEQNLQAKAFYEHIGFKVYKKSELDEQGNPYPILYMRLER